MAEKLRTYRELIQIPTFEERFEYLKLAGFVGESTFGFERYLNQMLYTSSKWRSLRNKIIVRDNGCDLGVEGYEISGKIIVHHINPMSVDDIKDVSDAIFDPDCLICVSQMTHNAIHYGDANLLQKPIVERRPGDTCLWK